MGRIVAIDYGSKRIGIAISDEKKVVSLPLTMVEAGKTHQATAEKIKEALAQKGAIEKIVIGLPLQTDGKEGKICHDVRAFGAALGLCLGLEIVYFDERFTSSTLDHLLKESGQNRKKRAGKLDAGAASLLLQDYLRVNP